MNGGIVDKLLKSDEPSVRFKVFVNVFGRDVDSDEIRKLQRKIKLSQRVKLLLSERGTDGNIPFHPYSKWNGAHWVLATLADIGYPSGDKSLIPLREQVLKWLLSKSHYRGIKAINGRVRRCGSQEGDALYALLKLGLNDDRTEELASRLTKWQWSDGGWNCDKKPEAINSSFNETLIPFRALALHARLTGNRESEKATKRAAEVFLKRRLCRRQRDGSIIRNNFVMLHCPCYWHYDILFGLKVMAEAGFIGDKRCHDALDLLESKRLPDGGFPSEAKYYRVIGSGIKGKRTSTCSLVNWGGASKTRMNEFVTADALYVLKKSGRFR